jgi:hypothetical protein
MGGLGNQLFQYAAARGLAHARGDSLKLDLAFFGQQSLRSYRLGHYSIQERFADAAEAGRLTGATLPAWRRWWLRLSNRAKPYYRRTVFREQRLLWFDPHIHDAPAEVYLEGYWQNEKYFAGVRAELRREFSLKEALSPASQAVAQSISAGTSVGVHIRRGDYVSNAQTNRVHGVCDLDYYHQCIDLVAARCRTPHFFVFSDDPEWAGRNLRPSHPLTLVRHNGPERDHEDLHLMSLCRHFILANSTFSWWAVWLSNSPDRLVCAPQRWFAADQYDPGDFIPAEWVRV